MSTSLPSPLQPLQGYPNNFANHDQPSSNSSSSSSSSSDNGSYSHVFIVLAIILVISVGGCVFGRLFCKGESSNKQPKQTNHVPSNKEIGQSSSTNQVRHFPGNNHNEEEDIEFGFDNKLKPIPSSKIASSDDGGGGGLAGFKPVSRNGEARGYVRFAPGGDIESSQPGPGDFRS